MHFISSFWLIALIFCWLYMVKSAVNLIRKWIVTFGASVPSKIATIFVKITTTKELINKKQIDEKSSNNKKRPMRP